MAVQGFNARNGNDQAPREEKAVSTLRFATAVQNHLGKDSASVSPERVVHLRLPGLRRVTTFATG
jgi:hypothetical protein